MRMLNTTERETAARASGRIDLASLVHNLPGIAYHCEWNGSWRMRFLSEGCRKLTGYDPADLVAGGGRDWDQLIHPDDLVRVRHEIDAAVADGSRFQVEYRARGADGVERWLIDDGGVSEVTGDGKVFLQGFVSDCTLYKLAEDSVDEANRTIERLAREDPLTGLANRRALEQNIVRAMSFARRWHYPLGVIMADIDHFKSVNDRYGHLVGDQVLISFSQLLKSTCRVEDLAVRFGGEEFLLLLPNSDIKHSEALANRLQQRLRDEAMPIPTPITVSLGVTVLGDSDTSSSLIDRADQALYVAKRRGRDRVETWLPDEAPDTVWETPSRKLT